jgi:hypothetical protein
MTTADESAVPDQVFRFTPGSALWLAVADLYFSCPRFIRGNFDRRFPVPVCIARGQAGQG